MRKQRISNKKIEQLYANLNSAPNSINLHDATLVTICCKNGKAILRLCLDDRQYSNDILNACVTNPTDNMILDLYFDGVKTVDFSMSGAIQLFYSTIVEVCDENGVYHIKLTDENANCANLSFAYTSFEWKLVGVYPSVSSSDINELATKLEHEFCKSSHTCD